MKVLTSRSAWRTIGCGWLLAVLIVPVGAQSNYATPYYFTTLAGMPSIGSMDGTGSAALFYGPSGVARDSAGNVYVTDCLNHTVRKITPAGMVSTLAGKPGLSGSVDGPGNAARFNRPGGLAIDSTGNLYVADTGNHILRKITPAGMVTIVAGLAGSSGSDDGTGSAARFNAPTGVAIDAAAILYITDTGNHTIRKVTATGAVTTLAGSAGSPGSADGPGTAARFDAPVGIAVDRSGQVYVADQTNSTIRQVTAAGTVSTLAGAAGYPNIGSTDGAGTAARFYAPNGLAVDAAGNIYVTESGNQTVRKISTAGVVSTLAGLGGNWISNEPASDGNGYKASYYISPNYGWVDGNGSAARFNRPGGLTLDPSGNVYIADSGNNVIRSLNASGAVTTIAGVAPAQSSGHTDGTGSAARFSSPEGVAVDDAGNVYVADMDNHTIRKITPTGVVTTLAGLARSWGSSDGTGSEARFHNPYGVGVDHAGNIYASDTDNNTVRKITPAGVVTALAGLADYGGWDDGVGSAARFSSPKGLAVDTAGNIFVLNSWLSPSIRKITPAGLVTTISATGGTWLAIDAAGKFTVSGLSNYTIQRVEADGTATLLAGMDGGLGTTDGTGGAARFFFTNGVAADATGNVYVADAGTNSTVDDRANVYVSNSGTIRKITPAGVVTTIAGLAAAAGSADGTGSEARFSWPSGAAMDAAGNLYVADAVNNTIRKGQLAGPATITLQPQSQTVVAGSNVQLSVSAGGVPAPAYQWYVNGSAFSGATSSTLSFTNARTTDAGDYTVVVANEFGSVTSAKATLTVSAAPVTPPEAPTSGGGGAIEPWLALGVAGLALLSLRRRLLPGTRGRFW